MHTRQRGTRPLPTPILASAGVVSPGPSCTHTVGNGGAHAGAPMHPGPPHHSLWLHGPSGQNEAHRCAALPPRRPQPRFSATSRTTSNN